MGYLYTFLRMQDLILHRRDIQLVFVVFVKVLENFSALAESVECLDFKVDKTGLHPLQSTVEAIHKAPDLKNV